MKFNKLKAIPIAIFYLIVAVWSGAQCMDDITNFFEEREYHLLLRDIQFSMIPEFRLTFGHMDDLSPKDVKKTIEYHKKEAKKDKCSQHCLGIAYNYGLIVKADKKEAVKWHKLAIENGEINAVFSLAMCYQEGSGNDIETAKLVQRLEDRDDVKHLLGMCYLYGIGVEKDEQKGITLIQEASNNININWGLSQYLHGMCYINGKGVEKDKVKAGKLINSSTKSRIAKEYVHYAEERQFGQRISGKNFFSLYNMTS